MTEEGKAAFLEAQIYPGDSILLPQSSVIEDLEVCSCQRGSSY